MQLTWKSFVAAMGAAVLLLALLGSFNLAFAQDTTTDTTASDGLFETTSVGGGASSVSVSSNGTVVPTELPETGGGFRASL
ncbi:MAG: hypothetical protein WCV62_01450 [Candidatus Peribacteraceae bacterium]|jgi:hypothetical protein